MSEKRIWSAIFDRIGYALTKKFERIKLEEKLKHSLIREGQLRSELLYLTMNPQKLMDNALEVERAIERTQSECNRRIQSLTRDLSSLECVQ